MKQEIVKSVPVHKGMRDVMTNQSMCVGIDTQQWTDETVTSPLPGSNENTHSMVKEHMPDVLMVKNELYLSAVNYSAVYKLQNN